MSPDQKICNKKPHRHKIDTNNELFLLHLIAQTLSMNRSCSIDGLFVVPDDDKNPAATLALLCQRRFHAPRNWNPLVQQEVFFESSSANTLVKMKPWGLDWYENFLFGLFSLNPITKPTVSLTFNRPFDLAHISGDKQFYLTFWQWIISQISSLLLLYGVT